MNHLKWFTWNEFACNLREAAREAARANLTGRYLSADPA